MHHPTKLSHNLEHCNRWGREEERRPRADATPLHSKSSLLLRRKVVPTNSLVPDVAKRELRDINNASAKTSLCHAGVLPGRTICEAHSLGRA